MFMMLLKCHFLSLVLSLTTLTWVDVLLGEAKVDNVDDLVLLHGGPTDEEVLGLDVPVDEGKH